MNRYCSSGKKPGDARLRAAIARHRRQGDARSEDPKPYDPAWGWWIESRIARLETWNTSYSHRPIPLWTLQQSIVYLATSGTGKPVLATHGASH